VPEAVAPEALPQPRVKAMAIEIASQGIKTVRQRRLTFV
jgi:hypothetical protein